MLSFISSFLKKSYGVTYIENFFSEDDFQIIIDECRQLNNNLKDEKYNIAEGRKGTLIQKDNVISRLCNSNIIKRKLKLPEHTFPADIPVEYRVYPIGSYMDWHADTTLYAKPQYEIVFTVFNTSDSKTLWYDPKTLEVNTIQTKPNSVIIVRADDVKHCVTPITRGSRGILKFVYTETLDKAPLFREHTRSLV